MFYHNYLKEKLNLNKTVIGTWCIIPSEISIDIICSTGIDFCIIDCEHGPITYETAQKMVITCESRNVSPIIRVGELEKSNIQKALDIAPHGIILPNITNQKQVSDLIRFAKYSPDGERGFSPFTRSGNYSLETANSVTKFSNNNSLVGINIEGDEGINNIDKILEFNYLDLVFIGTFDISVSLGVPGDVKNPKVIEKLNILTKKVKSTNKFVGTIATSIDDLKVFKSMGINFILYLVDSEMLRSSYQKVVNSLNKI